MPIKSVSVVYFQKYVWKGIAKCVYNAHLQISKHELDKTKICLNQYVFSRIKVLFTYLI